MVNTDGRNSAFYLTNAKELLDTEGEWYLDARASKLYYIPRKGENMSKAEVIVPAVETLLKVEGTPDDPVKDVTFEGITFSHATWLRPVNKRTRALASRHVHDRGVQAPPENGPPPTATTSLTTRDG